MFDDPTEQPAGDPGSEPTEQEYVPPTGDEPWAQYLENVPEVLKPEMVTAFRSQASEADSRIAALTPYQSLADEQIDPEAARVAMQFAGMLYGQPDPNDPVAVTQAKQAKLQFFEQYKAVLEEGGVLTKAEVAAEMKAKEDELAAAQEFETDEQKQLRELKAQQAELAEQQQQLLAQRNQEQQAQQESQQYQSLTSAYAEDWKTAIAQHGQLSKREFEVVTTFAKADQDDSPGVIQRAYNRLLTQVGRLPDEAPKGPGQRPPALSAHGSQQVPTPPEIDMGFNNPEGRRNRRAAAIEALNAMNGEQ